MNQQLSRRGLYLCAQVLNRALAALLGVYAARVLGPGELGIWAIFQILYLYTGQAHLGTVNAMLREVPMSRAHGDEIRAREIVEATWGFVWLAASVTAVVTGALVYCIRGGHQEHAGMLVFACVALAVVQLHSVFFNFYCFSYAELLKLALATVLQQVLTTATCVLLLAKFRVAGYLLSMAIGFTVMWIAVLFGPLKRLRPRFSWRQWRPLIVTGLPMLPGALMLYFNTSLDRLFVASRLGVAALGLFTVGAFLFQFGAALWDMAIYTIYPRLAALHATTDEDSGIIERAVAELLPGGIWMSSAIQGFLFLVSPLLVATILPRYSECVPMAQALVLAINVFGAGQFFTSNLTIIGRERFSVWVRLAGLVLRALTLVVALMISTNLLSLAIAIVVGQLLYAATAILSWHMVTGFDLKPAWQSFAGWACISAAAVACAYLSRSNGPTAVPSATVMYMALLIGFTLIVEHTGRTISRFWSFARV